MLEFLHKHSQFLGIVKSNGQNLIIQLAFNSSVFQPDYLVEQILARVVPDVPLYRPLLL